MPEVVGDEIKNNYPLNHIIIPVVIILILLASVILTVIYMNQRVTLTPSASYIGSNDLSLDNSYLFTSPVRAKAGGDLIRLTVFILDEKGAGIGNQQVIIKGSDPQLEIKGIQSLTDETGKALFDISSVVAGIYSVTAEIDGVALNQTAKLTFD